LQKKIYGGEADGKYDKKWDVAKVSIGVIADRLV
jgi:hypothetical protein